MMLSEESVATGGETWGKLEGVLSLRSGTSVDLWETLISGRQARTREGQGEGVSV